MPWYVGVFVFVGMLALILVIAAIITVAISYYRWKHGVVIIPVGPATDLIVHVTPKASGDQQFREAQAQYMEAKRNGELTGAKYYDHCQAPSGE